MEKRLCLLIYGEKDEIFKRDCENMKTVLMTDREGDINPISLPEFNALHLKYIMETESAIFEKLRNQPVPDRPQNEDMFNMMVYGVYSGMRLLKARANFILSKSFKEEFCEHSKAYISTYIQQIANFAFDRWTYWAHYTRASTYDDSNKANVLKSLMELKESKEQVPMDDAIPGNQTEMSSLTEYTPSIFMAEQEKRIQDWEAGWIREKRSELKKGTARKHVRKLFSMSVYSSGIFRCSYFQGDLENPVNTYQPVLQEWFLCHLKPIFLGRYRVESYSDETTEPNKRKIFQSLLKCLPECLAKSKQWLWLHYSGHNAAAHGLSSKLPSREIKLFYKLSRDLFSNVVLSLDCCFPDAPRRVSDTHVIALLACDSNERAIYSDGGLLSHFTEKLVHALKGFPPNHCPYNRGAQENACETCTQLNNAVKAARGSIFQQQLREFFTGHHSKYKVRCDSDYQFPLVSVGNMIGVGDEDQIAA